jgi:hypothetical protein
LPEVFYLCRLSGITQSAPHHTTAYYPERDAAEYADERTIDKPKTEEQWLERHYLTKYGMHT